MGDEQAWNKIEENVSRTYSLICGDVNPIHLHKYLAKLFGFRSNINHGMWSVARIIHQLYNDEQMIIGTTFKRPLFLPNTVTCRTMRDVKGKQARFKLLDKKPKLILQGYATTC